MAIDTTYQSARIKNFTKLSICIFAGLIWAASCTSPTSNTEQTAAGTSGIQDPDPMVGSINESNSTNTTTMETCDPTELSDSGRLCGTYSKVSDSEGRVDIRVTLPFTATFRVSEIASCSIDGQEGRCLEVTAAQAAEGSSDFSQSVPVKLADGEDQIRVNLTATSTGGSTQRPIVRTVILSQIDKGVGVNNLVSPTRN